MTRKVDADMEAFGENTQNAILIIDDAFKFSFFGLQGECEYKKEEGMYYFSLLSVVA